MYIIYCTKVSNYLYLLLPCHYTKVLRSKAVLYHSLIYWILSKNIFTANKKNMQNTSNVSEDFALQKNLTLLFTSRDVKYRLIVTSTFENTATPMHLKWKQFILPVIVWENLVWTFHHRNWIKTVADFCLSSRLSRNTSQNIYPSSSSRAIGNNDNT